jgi:large subunit ribosomal protein L15
MPHKLRKIRKTRGSRTQGYGRIGQHRKTGSQPYRKAGRHKQLWSYVTTYEPDYFGKHGFTSRQSKTRNTSVINLAGLEALASKVPVQNDMPQIIDLTAMGYAKLLGTGKITKALTIKVEAASKTALEKVAQAGGKIQTATEETGE